jgi:DNA processing protein
MTDGEDRKYLMFLHRVDGLGHKSLQKIIASGVSPKRIWQEFPSEVLLPIFGQGAFLKVVENWRETRTKFDEEGFEKQIQKQGVKVLFKSDKEYPSLLKQIYNSPEILYVRGTLEDRPVPLAFLGTRKYSMYGKQVAEMLLEGLADMEDVAVISGMALGIDGIVHRAALANNLYTVAVLGGGIFDDMLYPKSHTSLAHKILENGGAVISEFPPDTLPRTEYFPMRNRVVSGMSKGVLVVEAPLKSGSLITTNFALEQNRDVLAVPGNIDNPNAQGCNYLIKKGAILVDNVDVVLEEYGLQKVDMDSQLASQGLSEMEKSVVEALRKQSASTDILSNMTGIESTILMATVSLMELKGLVTKRGNEYCLSRNL